MLVYTSSDQLLESLLLVLFFLLVIHDLLVSCLSKDPQVSFRAAFTMFSLSLSKSQNLKDPNASSSNLGRDYLSGAVHAICLVLIS